MSKRKRQSFKRAQQVLDPSRERLLRDGTVERIVDGRWQAVGTIADFIDPVKARAERPEPDAEEQIAEQLAELAGEED